MTCEGCAYEDTMREVKREFPAFRIVRKEDSSLMKLVNGFLFFITLGQMRDFMKKFTTTLGCTVYVPGDWRELTVIQRIITLRHERVHMRQRARLTIPLFTFLYVFCPLPGGLAYFRTRFEKEAYEESIRSTLELYPNGAALLMKPAVKKMMVENFTGPAYFWMWPFRKGIEAWYDDAVARALHAQLKTRSDGTLEV